jgi:hypothetical protein
LYSILIEFGIPMELVKLIKMCSSQTYNEVRIGRNNSNAFPIQNGLKQMLYRHCFSTLLYNMPPEKSKETKRDFN